MGAPHTPTAAQLTKLAALQATQASAKTTLDLIAKAHTGTLAVANDAWINAAAAVTQYEAYIYGGQKPGIYDEGGQDVT